MKHLRAVNKYFGKYRWRFLLGIIFVIVSNYFGILAPQVTGYVMDKVQIKISQLSEEEQVYTKAFSKEYDPLVKAFINQAEQRIQAHDFTWLVMVCGITLLVLALLRGVFMFFMRQTIIVMSRLIEYDQKNEVYEHYQKLDTAFYKAHSTGDLMSRMAEDVSRVRMYTGPAMMYFINLVALIGLSLFYMFQKNWELTLYVLAPLPILAITIYIVNTIIHKRSENIQAQLSTLTTNAQESYSGIRVIKSFVQESTMEHFFERNSEAYKKSAVNLAKIEAIYFPSISLLIGLSTLLTIMIGGLYHIRNPDDITIGTIAEFVVYINMLTFPVSSIGWVASMVQRASASQKRLNEFLDTVPDIQNIAAPLPVHLRGHIRFEHVDFTYPHTGIRALKDFSLDIPKGNKIAVIGKTGSGKSTIAQLLLRMYDPTHGKILMDGTDIRQMDVRQMRAQISYVPQDVFLFSDSIAGNIGFGLDKATEEMIHTAARQAGVEKEIGRFPEGFQTMVGERGVTLSGGQKQRISIARAMIKDPEIVVFDDCLSAVDARTEKEIIGNLYAFLKDKTAIIITHRIFSLFSFDSIIVMDNGRILEKGTHEALLMLNGHYTEMYRQQQEQEQKEE
ncbi:ABC transporter ATP-binding protein [Agriterribacter sp.]|uniref:ABC transporter ATP-binding protein n=1 Tax=Agriterribacter sp. TaxID=2821509 RepID=UPI002C57538F|nr:ABC transporter ATP-binding protein [Agriterribacter sp.]HTN08289.1 ABC transporter ATP-binding protein [Agriterribacter sp.]